MVCKRVTVCTYRDLVSACAIMHDFQLEGMRRWDSERALDMYRVMLSVMRLLRRRPGRPSDVNCLWKKPVSYRSHEKSIQTKQKSRENSSSRTAHTSLLPGLPTQQDLQSKPSSKPQDRTSDVSFLHRPSFLSSFRSVSR